MAKNKKRKKDEPCLPPALTYGAPLLQMPVMVSRTLLHLLGVNHKRLAVRFVGRNIPLFHLRREEAATGDYNNDTIVFGNEENADMSASRSEPLTPVALNKDGPDRLRIEWSDGHHSIYTWQHLRQSCPCAGCREEREKPPDPFRILKSNELVPLAPVRMSPVGRYAYKIVWSDGHDSGIFTLEHLRSLCQCQQCTTGAAP